MSLFTRLSSNYFFYFAILGLVSPFLSVFLDTKGFNSIELGEIFAFLTATKIVAPSLWAVLADKTGQQLLIIRLGALCAFISFSLLFWLNSYWPISFSLALFSLFWTAILPQLEVLTLNSVRRSSKIYARVRLWGSLGFIALALVAGQVMEYFPIEEFTFSFTLMGSLILFLLLVSTLTIKPQRKHVNNSQAPIAIRSKLFESRFVIFFFAGLLLQVSFGPYYGFFALFLRDLSYSGFAVGVLISLGVVAEIIVFIYAGIFFKAFSLKQLLTFSLAITALRWYLVALFADSVWVLSFTQLMHAASFGLYHSASMLFISEHFSPCQQSRGQAVYLGGVYGLGGAIGAYLAGVLWLDGQGSTTTFIVASCAALLATLLMLLFKEKSPVKDWAKNNINNN
ncbi:MAG: MFS transporter [Colwellia sp.]|nr:MFS transporter [Colwellia sp.]MCW9080743.1 MFS transporter [Colwellia sp.]